MRSAAPPVSETNNTAAYGSGAMPLYIAGYDAAQAIVDGSAVRPEPPRAPGPNRVADLDLDGLIVDRQLTPSFAAGGAAVLAAPARPRAEPRATTQQKIEAFYGVRQLADGVIFAARFDGAGRVLIAGDFNNWSAMSTPMAAAADRPGLWQTKLPLMAGRYRYRFVVDGHWTTDPHNATVETNQFGELNNVVEVA